AEENSGAMHARARQAAGERSAVAAVVASTAKYECFLVGKVVAEAGLNGVEARAARGLHEQQRGGVVVLNGQAIDLANLFGGEYGLHVGMIAYFRSSPRN